MNWINKFISLSFPIKLIIGAIASVIAGPGTVGFMSEYASYYYALKIGVRPPLEGIPYLSVTTALASFIFALSASIIFMLTKFMITRIGGQLIDLVENILQAFSKGLIMLRFYTTAGGKFINKVSASDAIRLIKSLSLKKALFLSLFISILLIYLIKSLHLFKNINKEIILIGVASYITAIIFTIRSNSFAWIFAGLSVIAFYIASLGSLFNIETHREFLHLIGYGGDIPITVEFGSNESRENFYLAIRTTTSLIGKNNKGIFVEVPLSEVKSITYMFPQATERSK